MNNRVVIIYICERIQSIQINTFSYNSAYKNIYTSPSSKRGKEGGAYPGGTFLVPPEKFCYKTLKYISIHVVFILSCLLLIQILEFEIMSLLMNSVMSQVRENLRFLYEQKDDFYQVMQRILERCI